MAPSKSTPYMLPQALGEMKAQFPGIEITLISNKARVIQRVLSQEVGTRIRRPAAQAFVFVRGNKRRSPVSAFQCIEGLRNFCSHS